jgi:hypothetical protein
MWVVQGQKDERPCVRACGAWVIESAMDLRSKRMNGSKRVGSIRKGCCPIRQAALTQSQATTHEKQKQAKKTKAAA